MGRSIISPLGFAIKPRMPESCLICALLPRAPESTIMKSGLAILEAEKTILLCSMNS